MEKNEQQPEIQKFEVEKMLHEHPKHKRHTFSFTVDGDEFKGHFHEGEIVWMHPHPNQLYGEEKVAKIEHEIHHLLGQQGVSSQLQDIEMMVAFQDRPHERRQVILKVNGEEFKGFVHEGEIRWFHPHPNQKLNDEHIEVIESEIHEKVAKQSKGFTE
ncbi:hypothetical protein ACIQ34_09845 [Ureibacillus sp. NPDC094379]